jgi:putative transposase
MPRTARASVGGICYHVMNRANGGTRIFECPADYRAFENLIADAGDRVPMRISAWCLMPNHFHLVLWPIEDGDLSRWMQWLLTAHVRRYHNARGPDSCGRVWQGRFKAFPVQQDAHLLTVLRYVERNPLRASLTPRAEDWPWSSLGSPDALTLTSPLIRPSGWLELVNSAQTVAEVEALDRSVTRGTPLGTADWVAATVRDLGLESSIRLRGRPRKEVP